MVSLSKPPLNLLSRDRINHPLNFLDPRIDFWHRLTEQVIDAVFNLNLKGKFGCSYATSLFIQKYCTLVVDAISVILYLTIVMQHEESFLFPVPLVALFKEPLLYYVRFNLWQPLKLVFVKTS